jgi:TetR/AcrR family transcriptional repressor of nem operon
VKPIDRIFNYFAALTSEHERFGFRFGCLIGNLTLELAQASQDTQRKLASVMERWQGAISVCLREAQLRNEFAADAVPDEIAAVLIESWEGAAMRGKLELGPSSYRRFEKYVLSQLTQ